jgi:hypothetical protein
MDITVRTAQCTTKLRVQESDSVNVICESIPLCEAASIFLLAETVISPAFSFGFYGIHDGDEIVVLDGRAPQGPDVTPGRPAFEFPTLCQLRQHSSELTRVFGYPPGMESLQRAMEELADPELASEAAKLRDRYFSRIEGSAASHRRLLLRFARQSARDLSAEDCQDSKLFVDMKAPVSPSREELPACWKTRRRKCLKG